MVSDEKVGKGAGVWKGGGVRAVVLGPQAWEVIRLKGNIAGVGVCVGGGEVCRDGIQLE